MLPHSHLYTRLRPSPGRGIGVFAIRDIPAGLDPFAGEGGEVVHVPLAEVERIDDPELRQFYFDFCPLADGRFVAPVDFNSMTVAWYMNHSAKPNVVPDRALNFVTARLIARGEELTVDYRMFSDHAERFVEAWGRDPDRDGPRVQGSNPIPSTQKAP